MVVDASSLLAVLLGAPDSDFYHLQLKSVPQLWISPVNLWEAQVRLLNVFGPRGELMLSEFTADIALEVTPIDGVQAGLAFEAFRRFGGRPSRLNMGDCFAYALAKSKGAPLLFKGNDFLATDVERA